MVEVVIGLARALGLGVVADGVETPAQLEMLRRLGCGRAQGLYLGRPVEPSAVAEWLLDRRGPGRCEPIP